MSNNIYGLVGKKLGHSYSKLIHNMLGNDSYELYELTPEELGPFLKQDNICGLNVTIPYKIDALASCDVISEEVEAIGAANTLVRRNGRLHAFNTDMYGFIYMTKSAGIDVSGKKVAVLGTGGASRAIVAGLKNMGAGEIVMISRKGPVTYSDIDTFKDAQVVVNTTPVGMFPDNLSTPTDLSVFENLTGVLDIVYNPHLTGLLLKAESLGIPFAGGLTMLVAQAKRAHQLFFGEIETNEINMESFSSDPDIDRITAKLVRDAQNIALIGMPGSGKTSIAGALAKLTGREVIDLDAEITKAAGKPIPQIFADDGEEVFREIETAEIAKAGALSGKILSLGGGAVTKSRNYPLLHQNSIIIEIRRDLDTLDTAGRPLSVNLEALRKMEVVRRPMYDSFRDFEIINDSTIDAAAQKLVDVFNNVDI